MEDLHPGACQPLPSRSSCRLSNGVPQRRQPSTSLYRYSHPSHTEVLEDLFLPGRPGQKSRRGVTWLLSPSSLKGGAKRPERLTKSRSLPTRTGWALLWAANRILATQVSEEIRVTRRATVFYRPTTIASKAVFGDSRSSSSLRRSEPSLPSSKGRCQFITLRLVAQQIYWKLTGRFLSWSLQLVVKEIRAITPFHPPPP
eukprot:234687-Amphidinium_carterae.1